MSIRVACSCGVVIVVPDDRAGRAVGCPRCRQEIQVPGAGPPPLGESGAARKKRWTEPPAGTAPAPAGPPPLQSAGRSGPSEQGVQADPAQLPAPAESSAPPALPTSAASPAAPTASTESPVAATAVKAEPSTSANDEEVEAPPLPTAALPGLEPSVEGRRSAFYLAVSVALIGLFSGLPAMVHVVQHFPAGLAMPRWAACLLLLSGLHLAYAVYVAQLPDWSTVWVVAITMLSVATLDSLLLAATLLGRGDGSIVRLLELHDQVRGGRAAGWCFIMLCLSVTVAYCAGRMAARWHSAETARLQALHMLD